MMAADEHRLLQRTLQDLDYQEAFDDKSIPLLKKLLLDMKVLSEHSNELEKENSVLRGKQASAGGSMDANETYILDVVNMANDKIESLTRDLNTLRRENADLKSHDMYESVKNGSHQQEVLKLKCLETFGDVAKFLGQLGGSSSMALPEHVSNFSDLEEAIIICQNLLLSAKNNNLTEFDGQVILKLKESSAELEKKIARLSSQLASAEALNLQLNSSAASYETQKTLLDEITCQITVLDRLNNSLNNILRQIELSGSSQDAENHISSLLEVLLAELNTELSFSSHLSKITDKMNQRLLAQEKSIDELRKQFSDALNELAQSKENCVRLATSNEVFEKSNKDLCVKLDQLNSTLLTTKSAHARDQKSISELQNTIKTLKGSSESSKVVLKKLKHQEESIRLKNLDLEGRIDTLQQQLDSKTRELLESERSIQTLKCELASIKSHGDLNQSSFKNVEIELAEIKNSFEITKIGLEAAKKKCHDLEAEIGAKKKEKDLMMVTHFKLIKSNEKISTELEFCKKELQRLRSAEIPSKDRVSTLVLELEHQKAQTASYSDQCKNLKVKLTECEERMMKSNADLHIHKSRIDSLESEIASAKKQIQILEKTRSENFFQLAKLTEKLNDAKSSSTSEHYNALQHDHPQPRPVTTSIDGWKDNFLRADVAQSAPLFDSFLDSISSNHTDDDTYAANGIIHDWARKNKELRDHLKHVQEELKNEVSFAVGDVNQSIPDAPIIYQIDKKRAVESEHQVLMDIVSRVKSDLRQAAMTSPGSPARE